MIRAAAIIQTLLGNIGRPGGGILALRGHSSIQGSTDIPTLYNLLPGYLPQPSARKPHKTLKEYLGIRGAHCAAGQTPQFVLGFAQLQQRIGASMGNPLECEHADPGSGDTQQHTSTGLAYVPHSGGLVSFTSGWEHYALDGGQVDLWRNESVAPPRPTDQDRAYLDDNAALRGRVDQLDAELTGFLHQGQAGNLDAVDFGTLGGDVDELQMLRDTFVAAAGPANLSAFTDGWLQAQDADIAAGEALLQARLDSDPSNVEANLSAASTELLRRDQRRSSAAFALSEVLTVAYH